MLRHVEVGRGKYGVGLVDNLFGSLDFDKAEWLDEIEKGDSFGKEVQFKKYLHGPSDAGTRLLDQGPMG